MILKFLRFSFSSTFGAKHRPFISCRNKRSKVCFSNSKEEGKKMQSGIFRVESCEQFSSALLLGFVFIFFHFHFSVLKHFEALFVCVYFSLKISPFNKVFDSIIICFQVCSLIQYPNTFCCSGKFLFFLCCWI